MGTTVTELLAGHERLFKQRDAVSGPLDGDRPSALLNTYVLAALCSVFSVLLTQLVNRMGRVSTVLIYLAAVVVCSSLAGFRSGVLTLAASLISALHDLGSLPAGPNTQDVVRYLLFAGISLSLCLLLGHRNRLHKQLQVARLAAEASDRAKSQFLANMSHEIRTPLNGIIGMAELAVGSDSREESRECLATVSTCAESLLFIVDNILDFSSIQDRTFLLEEVAFSVEEQVAGAVKAVQIAAQRKHLTITTNCSDNMPAAVLGDAKRLQHVLIALLANAIEFTKEGAVVVCASLEERLAGRVVLHFSIRDTGCGVSPDKRRVIFDAFNQADNSATRRHGGIGLGLAICKKLVNLMGGRIWLESHSDQGSIFHFTVNFSEGPHAAGRRH